MTLCGVRCASSFRRAARVTGRSSSRRRLSARRRLSSTRPTTRPWSSSRTASTASWLDRPSRRSSGRRFSACTRLGRRCASRPPTGSGAIVSGSRSRPRSSACSLCTAGAERVRVGLNVLHLVPRETGGGELYVRRLVPALLEAGGDLELVVFAGDEAAPSLARERWASDVELVHLHV